MSQGKKHSEDDLRLVARLYKEAHESRESVQKAVAKFFGVSISTASKRVMEARRRGYLETSETLALIREYEETKAHLKMLEEKLSLSLTTDKVKL